MKIASVTRSEGPSMIVRPKLRWSAAFCLAAFFCCFQISRAGEAPARVEAASNLATAGDQIRQFAFDGNEKTAFVSAESPHAGDWFELKLDEPVRLQAVAVATGQADGRNKLDSGWLELSADGGRFERVADVSEGKGEARFDARPVKALRVVVAADLSHPLAIREVTLQSTPQAAVFRYPVEFVVDTSDDPAMNDWARDVARTCEKAYPMINEALRSDGYQPPHLITFAIKDDYDGVAATSDRHIVAATKYFSRHLDDVGAIVHETAHVVQQYRGRRAPGWLVEGIADYVRFFKFEPGKLGPIDARRARYDRSYGVSAAFLAYLVEKHDAKIVQKLNQALRAGEYRDEMFRELTGKTLDELDAAWRATLN